ncbi:MAG TPA: formate/nitrite transporter family protein [Draconibacterium sp.]|nr:formate/nitrite transporter family protein [Draconibacterium sp.]
MRKQAKDIKEALNQPKKINEILDEQIESALHEHNRSNQDLFLSGISAGLEVGFSVFLMAVIYSLFNGIVHPSVLHTLIALAYPIGFIFVIIGRSELFTEHTTLAVIPVLNRNASVKSLLILWGIIYVGNLLGGYVFSYILSFLPERLNTVNNGAYFFLAEKLIQHPWHIIVGSGILAGWLMGLLSWLVTSSQETISRILIIAFITAVIGIGGLHHSIVGSIEVFTAAISSDLVGWKEYVHVQIWATVGNMIGGVVFVALIKYSHINPSKKRGTIK